MRVFVLYYMCVRVCVSAYIYVCVIYSVCILILFKYTCKRAIIKVSLNMSYYKALLFKYFGFTVYTHHHV